MRPGKPVAFGRIARAGKDQLFVFGLPGNPVSALVSFELFVRPSLLRMMGRAGRPRPLWPAVVVDSGYTKKAGLEHYARGVARITREGLKVRLDGGQGSHHMSGLARSNALVRFPVALERASAGDVVELMLLDDPLAESDFD